MDESVARLLTVCGTGTEVGKTWVSAQLLSGLRARGIAVAASKLAQSYEPGAGPTDAEVLAEASGQKPNEVCPDRFSYEVPMAPIMAAGALDRPDPLMADLLDAVTWPDDTEFALIETAGGVRSPLALDGDAADLVNTLSYEFHVDDVLLVADAGLGTINDVRLTVAALEPVQPVVFLNRWSADVEVHRRNRAWLTDVDYLEVVVDIDALVDLWVGDLARGPRRGSL